LTYRTQLFTTKYRCGNAYVACGNKSYLAFGILDNGDRVEIPTLIELDAFIPEIQRMMRDDTNIFSRLSRVKYVSPSQFRVPIRFN
jgi:hypothetical protein